MKKIYFALITLPLLLLASCQSSVTMEQIEEQFLEANYTKATQLIAKYRGSNELSAAERYKLDSLIDMMMRIRRDFYQEEKSVIDYIKEHYPEVTKEEIEQWESSNAIENMVIDGKKQYFHSAGRNLFRIDKGAASHFKLPNEGQSDSLNRFLAWYIPELIEQYKKGGNKQFFSPTKMRVNYSLSVKADEVPAGEMVRVWMPFPRGDVESHTDIKLLSTSQPEYLISPDSYAHKTIYMEAPAVAGEPTNFSYQFEYCSWANFSLFSLDEVKEYDTESQLYREFTSERAPHTLFDQNLVERVKEIVGDESNPYLKARKIYRWIDNNFPWASAREYSTIANIPQYVLANNHGDCGQVTLLFIAMARIAGIPAKWQSGWMMHPGNRNLHDWGEAYFEGIGWVPVDQSFGLVKGREDDEESYHFFTRGLDPYRLIVNQDISRPLYPAKIYPRSETVDFQRGEVEWRGENLYFGRWRYKMEIEYL